MSLAAPAATSAAVETAITFYLGDISVRAMDAGEWAPKLQACDAARAFAALLAARTPCRRSLA